MEDPLTTYYRSRQGESPAIFVQEEGRWRAYAANGALQRSTGLLPETILTRVVEITPEQGEALIAAWTERAQALQRRQTADVRAAAPAEAAAPARAATAAARPSPTLYAPPARLRPRGSRRWVYAAAGTVMVIVIAVLLVLALTGNLKTGATAATGTSDPTGSGGTATTEYAPELVVAKVSDHEITGQQLDERIADFKAQYPGKVPDRATAPEQYRQFELGALDYLVTYQLAAQSAAALAIEVTDDDVATEMEFIRSISFDGDQARFESAVQEQGLTMDRFAQIYRESLLLNKMFAEVTKAVAVTDGEVQAYFDQHATGTYADKALADVEDDIRSTLLDIKQQESWSKWLAKKRQTIGVAYSDGWVAPDAATTPVS